jgi:hypothetical protein
LGGMEMIYCSRITEGISIVIPTQAARWAQENQTLRHYIKDRGH